MRILGIESTCDETSASVVENGKHILSLVTASSADIHARYGGVFPELACRRHIEAILPVIEEALTQAGCKPSDLDGIAVARGPGLIGALLIGMQAAKGLAISLQKPFIGVNHVEAHLYAAMMREKEPPLPALGLVLSGGHTLLLKIEEIGSYTAIGTTVDDAAGEAFDKVAVLLGLPYPGGPHVELLAKNGNPKKFPFKAGKVKKSPVDFSFSGIKTSVLYAVRDKVFSLEEKADVAASFQDAVFSDIIAKTKIALTMHPEAKAIYLGGGVCNNLRLQEMFNAALKPLPIFWPEKQLTLDNAAMIAGLGFHKFLKNPLGDSLDIEVLPRIPIA